MDFKTYMKQKSDDLTMGFFKAEMHKLKMIQNHINYCFINNITPVMEIENKGTREIIDYLTNYYDYNIIFTDIEYNICKKLTNKQKEEVKNIIIQGVYDKLTK